MAKPKISDGKVTKKYKTSEAKVTKNYKPLSELNKDDKLIEYSFSAPHFQHFQRTNLDKVFETVRGDVYSWYREVELKCLSCKSPAKIYHLSKIFYGNSKTIKQHADNHVKRETSLAKNIQDNSLKTSDPGAISELTDEARKMRLRMEEKVINATALLIAGESLPFSLVDSDFYKNFLNELGFEGEIPLEVKRLKTV